MAERQILGTGSRVKSFTHVFPSSNLDGYNIGPGDWQNVFTITGFRYRGSFPIHFAISEVKKIIRYIENLVISSREVRYIEVPLYYTIFLKIKEKRGKASKYRENIKEEKDS